MTTGRRRAASSGDDELMSRLYEQITKQEASQFAAEYDMAAGLDRYKAWLEEHTVKEQRSPQAIPVTLSAAAAHNASAEMFEDLLSAVEGGRSVPRRNSRGPSRSSRMLAFESENLVANVAALGSVRAELDAEQTLTELYATHFRSLVRLAALLVRDSGVAEEVVQDSFVAMYRGWARLRDADKALSYLRQSVVNKSRSVLRHRVVVDPNAPKPPPDEPSAEHGAVALFERAAVVEALRSLPTRQREAVVLRFYGDLSEAQIAEAMQISQGAVKSHTARAMATLRILLERDG